MPELSPLPPALAVLTEFDKVAFEGVGLYSEDFDKDFDFEAFEKDLDQLAACVAAPPNVDLPVVCWGCHKEEQAGDTVESFLQCPFCVEEKRFPVFFCSNTCYMEHGPRHREWHEEATKRDKNRQLEDQRLQENQSTVVDSEIYRSSPYDRYISQAIDKIDARDYDRASMKLRKARKVRPDRPEAYYHLSSCYHHSCRPREMALFLQIAAGRCAAMALLQNLHTKASLMEPKRVVLMNRMIKGWVAASEKFLASVAMGLYIKEKPKWLFEGTLLNIVTKVIWDELKNEARNDAQRTRPLPTASILGRMAYIRACVVTGFIRQGRILDSEEIFELLPKFVHATGIDTYISVASEAEDILPYLPYEKSPDLISHVDTDHVHGIRVSRNVLEHAQTQVEYLASMGIVPIPTDETTPKLEAGSWVTIHGFPESIPMLAAMNGKLGRVCDVAVDDKREGFVAVQVDGMSAEGGAWKYIRPKYLEEVPLSELEVALVACTYDEFQWKFMRVYAKVLREQYSSQVPAPAATDAFETTSGATTPAFGAATTTATPPAFGSMGGTPAPAATSFGSAPAPATTAIPSQGFHSDAFEEPQENGFQNTPGGNDATTPNTAPSVAGFNNMEPSGPPKPKRRIVRAKRPTSTQNP